MSAERKTYRAAVYMILERDGKYLVIRRCGSGYRDGEYTFPAGHVDDGETATMAAVRELNEEVGIEINENSLKFIHAMQRHESDEDYFDFYFKINKWTDEPEIREPNKMDDLRWATPNEINKIAVPQVAQAIQKINAGELFSCLIME